MRGGPSKRVRQNAEKCTAGALKRDHPRCTPMLVEVIKILLRLYNDEELWTVWQAQHMCNCFCKGLMLYQFVDAPGCPYAALCMSVSKPDNGILTCEGHRKVHANSA
jgi:hypothetical protein